MPRIYSWKLSDKTYAYLVNPDKTNESCLRKRITNSEELKTMVNTINTWTESEYQTRFNEMNEKIIKSYGVGIPWNSSFFNDTDTAITTIIDNDFDRDEYKSEILNEVSSNIDEVIGSLNLKNDATINDLRNTITNTNLSVLSESKGYVDEKVTFLTKTISDNKKLFDDKLGELRTTVGDFYVEIENKTGNITGSITDIEDELTKHATQFDTIADRIEIVEGETEANINNIIAERFRDIDLNLDNKIFNKIDNSIGALNISGQINTAIISFEDRFDPRIGNIEDSVEEFKNNLSGFSGNLVTFRGEIASFDDQIKNFQTRVTNVESANTEISDLRTQIITLQGRVDTTVSSVSSLSGQVSSVKTDIETINTDIDTIGNDFNSLSTTLTKFNSGITFSPQIRQPLGSSISPHVSGYNYRTSTGHEIIVDDEIIELKSDKARIYIDDTGIHLEGDVFINGVKIK